MHKRFPLLVIGVVIAAADQAVKFFLTAFLNPGDSIPVIKNVFHITLVFNTGCAFGLCRYVPNFIFIGAACVAVIFFLYFLKCLRGKGLYCKVAAVLVIAGAVSNIIDRARVGYVIDFLDFRVWPVFNLGDTAVTIGAAMFAYIAIRRRRIPRCIP